MTLSRYSVLAAATSVLFVACSDAESSGAAGVAGSAGSQGGAGGSSAESGGSGGAAASSDSAMGGDGGASGMSDAGPVQGSDGCGKATNADTEEWLEQTVDVGGTSRTYFVYLPAGYDADRAYPVVYQFHGCSDNRETNNVPVEKYSASAAIHVRGRAVDRCWEAAADGPDVAFFDALVPDVEANWCADPAARFATGYSSGAFLAHRLACHRGDMLRGVATIAGGLGGSACEGKVAALLIHDENDDQVEILASETARDSHVARNGCDPDGARAPTEPAPCEAYPECDVGYPVVWCQTSGNGHARQDELAGPAFWDFIDSLL